MDDSGKSLGFALAVVYVDDILMASSTVEAEERIVSVISGVVPTKTTGQIDENGGSLSFIGRTISREPHGAEIRLSVNPSYLDSTFAEYGVVKGSEHVPDIASHMERTVSSSEHQKPLSDEAYTKFRRGLGRLFLHERFSECECPKRADLGNTSFTQTGFYNRKLARSLLSAVRAAKKKHA